MKKYEKAFGKHQREHDGKVVLQKATEEKPITMEDLIELRDDYDDKILGGDIDKANVLRRLILHLYTEIPSLRSQDYINTSFEEGADTNYLDFENKLLVIKNWKTKKEGEAPRIIKLPDGLLKVVEETKDYLCTKWLIPYINDTSRNMQNAAFTKSK